MAAYGSLVSLMQIIDELQHHPSPPISLDKLQLQSLTQTITFLQEFLEGYNSHYADSQKADPLETRIMKAAYEAEDVIESYIVANIKLAASKIHDEQISCINFYEDLQRVIEEMDVIKKVAMEIPTEKAAVVQDLQQLRKLNVPASVGLNNHTMVGFDEVLLEILDKLTAGRLDRQAIPIVGMGGIGKTTLARSLYAQPLVKEHFDICVWVSISQQFNPKQILCEVLSQRDMGNRSEDEVQLAVHQYLSRRRFLIVMDDMWSIDPWNKIQRFFPDDNNGSRILVTTRLSALGSQLDKSNGTLMKFLDGDSSWALFSQTIFGEESFPVELVEIGKKIVESCKGLPLTIAVIGGLLKKLQHTQECWESIGKDLNSAVSLESDEYCLKILKMSYNHLPVHLKPCFLYMGVFEEDCEIRVSALVRLWVSEGFLKPISGKSLETTAKEYLRDLVGRNLVLAHKLKSDGNIQFCKIHDLLREVCLREAQKEKFYHVIEPQYSYPAIYRERCIVIPKNIREEKLVSTLQYIPHARSLILWDDSVDVDLKPNCGLLRSLLAFDLFGTRLRGSYDCPLEDVFELVNLRYLAVAVFYPSKFFSSINLMWNLHTLIVDNRRALSGSVLSASPEFWKMSQLRHVHFSPSLRLPDPPRGNNDIVIMENLQTLMGVFRFKCSEEVVKRIPNIKKLRINQAGDYCLNNLSSLHKLENFWCHTHSNRRAINNLTFPQSLQKLTLIVEDKGLDCENALEKIGSLPLLRKLVLKGGIFKRRKWETVEGEFRSLRFLELGPCNDLQVWEMADCSHFPRLEHLLLSCLVVLEEIPWEIGEIATLKSVALILCSVSAVKSMKKIVEEQEDLQGEQQLGFHVRVVLWKKNTEALQSLASPNFKVSRE